MGYTKILCNGYLTCSPTETLKSIIEVCGKSLEARIQI